MTTTHARTRRPRRGLLALAAVFAIAAVITAGTSLRHPGTASAGEGENGFRVCNQYFRTGSTDNFGLEFEFQVEVYLPGDDSPLFIIEEEMALHEGNEECTILIGLPDEEVEVKVFQTSPAGWVHTLTYPRWNSYIGGSLTQDVEGVVAKFTANDNCHGDGCRVTFKNKQDEAGEGITPPPGDPIYGAITVCKDFRDNGDEVELAGKAFTFNIGESFVAVGPFMREGDLGCTTTGVTGDLFPGQSVTVVENETPDFTNAPGFPRAALESPNTNVPEHAASQITFVPSECGFDGPVDDFPPETERPIASTYACTVTFANQAPVEGEAEPPTGPEPPTDEPTEPEEPGNPGAPEEGETPEDPVDDPEPAPAPQPDPGPEPIVIEPPCLDCMQPAPVATQPAPTATPTDPAAPATPTEPAATPSPASPTPAPATSTPVSTVAGEQTPLAGITPIAPNTGTGTATATSSNGLILAAGLAIIALACTLGALAPGR